MDTISHALWGGALFKSINIKSKKKRFKFWQAAFFGMFPDIISFVIPFIIFFIIIITQTGFNIAAISDTVLSPPYSNIVDMLYNISHSLIIFSLVFLLIWLIFRRPIWIVCGWLLHILIDIPTHLKSHFPTPMLWPISNFKINGIIYWREPLFMIIDILLLIIVYWVILWKERKLKNKRK
ncbi:MAG: metal-dependent hydrolase [Nanobdellota archaeon]